MPPKTPAPIRDPDEAYRIVYAAFGGIERREIKDYDSLWNKLRDLEPFWEEVSFHGVHERKYRHNKRVYSVILDGGEPYDVAQLVRMKKPKPADSVRQVTYWTVQIENDYSVGWWPMAREYNGHHDGVHYTSEQEARAAIKAHKKSADIKSKYQMIRHDLRTEKFRV